MLLAGEAAESCATLVIADSVLGAAAEDPATVARLRRANYLVVFGWADTALARAADVALPIATHAEKSGTFVNSAGRVQPFEAAFPSPGQVRSGVEVLADLLTRFDASWKHRGAAEVYAAMVEQVASFNALKGWKLPSTGAPLPEEVVARMTTLDPLTGAGRAVDAHNASAQPPSVAKATAGEGLR